MQTTAPAKHPILRMVLLGLAAAWLPFPSGQTASAGNAILAGGPRLGEHAAATEGSRLPALLGATGLPTEPNAGRCTPIPTRAERAATR
jgi:hypothetical protein